MIGNYYVIGNIFIEVIFLIIILFVLVNVLLMNGQKYCVKFKVENKVGLVSLEVFLDGFIVDVMFLSVCKVQVCDGNIGLDFDFQESNIMLLFQWDEFVDLEFGIECYEYGVSRNCVGVFNIFLF